MHINFEIDAALALSAKLIGALAIYSCLLAIAEPASAQSNVGGAQVLVLDGSCDKLTLGKRKMADRCSPKMMSTSYPHGRVGFYFIMEDGTGVTISGMDGANPTPDTDVTVVDKVIVNLDPKKLNKPDVFPATGKCTFGNPYKGEMTISCKGKLRDGRAFAGSFTTDGAPPR